MQHADYSGTSIYYLDFDLKPIAPEEIKSLWIIKTFLNSLDASTTVNDAQCVTHLHTYICNNLNSKVSKREKLHIYLCCHHNTTHQHTVGGIDVNNIFVSCWYMLGEKTREDSSSFIRIFVACGSHSKAYARICVFHLNTNIDFWELFVKMLIEFNFLWHFK